MQQTTSDPTTSKMTAPHDAMGENCRRNAADRFRGDETAKCFRGKGDGIAWKGRRLFGERIKTVSGKARARRGKGEALEDLASVGKET